MSRIARVVVENVPYHVTQRGNSRQEVFSSDTDCRMYLDLLRTNAERHYLRVWAYCLMPNHVHLLVVPERPGSMAHALGRTHADYARYFNLKRSGCGHVWQARYYSCPLDGIHRWLAMAYIERNPVRGGLIDDAAAYRWSSAAAHTGGQDQRGVLWMADWRQEYSAERWRQALETTLEEESVAERLREATARGRPLGDEDFVRQLEGKTDRRLRPRPAGRPRKLVDVVAGPCRQQCLALENGV